MSGCPFHGDAHLFACGYCRRAKRRASREKHNEKRRNDRAYRRVGLNRPPPTEAFYVDHPENSTAEDVAAILKTMVKEFRR